MLVPATMRPSSNHASERSGSSVRAKARALLLRHLPVEGRQHGAVEVVELLARCRTHLHGRGVPADGGGEACAMSTPTDEDTGLQRSLRQRHMTMISLGGVIGAGLFVGSGAVMNKTGPAAVLSYLRPACSSSSSCGCSARWRSPTRPSGRSSSTAAARSAAGRLLHRLAVLVLLGDRPRHRGRRRRDDPAALAARRAGVADEPRRHGAADRDEPRRR